MDILKEFSNDKIIEFNKINIEKYLSKKHINIENIEDIFNKIEIEIGEKKEFPYACIDRNNSYKIIISEDILETERYKWLNHEMIHVISNNQPTVNEVNVGGIIIEDKDIWIGQYLNEAITEYINQSIINSKYSNYYYRYIDELKYIISIIGEEVILKAYFTNNLYLIVDNLSEKTSNSKDEVLEYINSIDYLYDDEE